MLKPVIKNCCDVLYVYISLLIFYSLQGNKYW